MRGRRWDKAAQQNTADPTPLFPYPNAYDLQINISSDKRTVFIGPSLKLKDPQGRFDHANVTAGPTATPRYILGWKGDIRLSFKFPSKGAKSFQFDYLDVAGELLGTKVIEFALP